MTPDSTQREQGAGEPVYGARPVRSLLEEALLAAPGALQSAQRLSELDGLDSLGVVLFIGLVTEHHGVELTLPDMRYCETIGDLEQKVRELSVRGA